jgi:hypothetical protein
VGMNMIFPESVKIVIDVDDEKKIKEEEEE